MSAAAVYLDDRDDEQRAAATSVYDEPCTAQLVKIQSVMPETKMRASMNVP